MRYAISACLTGVNCKYSGGNNLENELMEYIKDKEYMTICPEVLGGLPIPRLSCEIVDGKILNTANEDCTEAFYVGARIALEQIIEYQADIVILQPRSPSCGVGHIYDGTFQGRLKDGNGIFVEMLLKEGIPAMTWEEFSASTRKEQ
ncbi:MAG: DUF523 domain-containing protein [Longicatena sp.]